MKEIKQKIYSQAMAVMLAFSLATTTLLTTIMPVHSYENSVAINAANFPDANFRTYVKKFDKNSDNTLSSTEINSVTSIYAPSRNIKNLVGVEYFAKLESLNCNSNQLTWLDLSANTMLRKLSCINNQLTSLNMRSNPELIDINCGSNQLTSLDISNNTNLQYLNCDNNKLTTLDVSKNAQLQYLLCDGNQLYMLNLKNNKELLHLDCCSNQLLLLNVKNNLKLIYLICDKNLLASLDISNNTNLTFLECSDNCLTSLDVSNNTKLTSLRCNNNQLTSLNVSNNVNPSCNGNQYNAAFSNYKINVSLLYGNFDVSKISNVSGGKLFGDVIAFNTNSDKITYDYDCGNGNIKSFVIVNTEGVAPKLTGLYASTLSKTVEPQTIRVLVISLDPVLTQGTIEGRDCSGMRASEALGQDADAAVQELITDIYDSSHGLINVEIVDTEDENEFPTYTQLVTRLDGTSAYSYDEATWVDIMKNGWYAALKDSRFEVGNHVFNYKYLAEKYDLIKLHNEGKFDAVWLVNVDPSSTDEAMMIGNDPFYINGSEIDVNEPEMNLNCDNFAIMNVSTSRPDVNYECFGHFAECVLAYNFEKNLDTVGQIGYHEDIITLNENSYAELNPFEKFFMVDRSITNEGSGYAGVGNIHFSPNSTKDYEWNNTQNHVLSKWREWENYPNISTVPSTEVFDPNEAYLNEQLEGTNSDARKHHRWWFSLMPHTTGRTEEGFDNNWWNYLGRLDYVKAISAQQSTITLNAGDIVSAPVFDISYHTEKVNTFTYDAEVNYVTLSNNGIIEITKDGRMKALKKGVTNITVNLDGCKAVCRVIVK